MDVDPGLLAWFAFPHDSQRVDDGRHPRHAHRAADFALKLRREGVVDELDAPGFEHLCEAMRLHSDGHTTGEPAIAACWDADRLCSRFSGLATFNSTRSATVGGRWT